MPASSISRTTAGCAHDDAVVRDDLVLCDERASADQAVAPDPRPFRTVAHIPIRVFDPIVHPCTMA